MIKLLNKKNIFNILCILICFTVSLTGKIVIANENGETDLVDEPSVIESAIEENNDVTTDGEKTDENGGVNFDSYLDSFIEISKNTRLTMLADTETGEVAIKDAATGEIWFSNPWNRENDRIASGFFRVILASQILMTYSDIRGVVLERGSSLHSVGRGGLSHEIRGDSIVFKYDFVNDDIMIPVMFSIADDSFKASILTNEIEQRGDNELINIDLLPYFGAGSLEDEGYLMVPDGTGALIYMNNGKTSAVDYNAPVYGVDDKAGAMQIPPSAAWMNTVILREEIRLPVFGMKRNNTGFLAVIKESEARAAVKATVSGRGTNYNSVYSQLRFRMSGTVLLTQQEFSERRSSIAERLSAAGTNYTVVYYLLENENANYVGMAEKLREYQIQEFGLTPKVNPGNIPLYLDLYGYINKVKPFLGIPIERVIPLTTLKDVEDITGILFDAGIENVVVKLNNWVRNASFGKIPVRANFERRVGSSREFASLEKYLAENGGSVYLSNDLINVYQTGYGFSRFSDSLKSVANTPSIIYRQVYDSAAIDTRFPGWYLLNPIKFGDFFNRYTGNFAKLNTNNISLDSIGSMVYSDMSSNGVSRTDIPGIIENTLENVTGEFSSLMLTGGNFFAVPFAEHIVNIPQRASFYDIIDEHIPFYQIVYHGIVNYSITSSNLSSNPEHVFLKCLETGASPMYSWVGRNSHELFNTMLNTLYSADYKVWIDFAIEDYKEINSVLSAVSDKPITGHRKISEGVFSTTYGDVLEVTVNYNHYDVNMNGTVIEGFGYVVREVGGTNG